MRNGEKIFWGSLFLLTAVAIIAGQLGYLDGFSFWSILVSLGVLGILLSGIHKRRWGTLLFSLAFLCIINARPLGIENLTPWPVLGAALFGAIGLNILFPLKKGKKSAVSVIGLSQNSSSQEETFLEEDGSEIVRCEVNFQSSVKYLHCQALRRASFESSFGSLTIYFTDARLYEGRAEVKVDVSFGSMELYVPANWLVVDNVSSSFSHASQDGIPRPGKEEGTDGVPVLSLTGDVSFGTLEIHYL